MTRKIHLSTPLSIKDIDQLVIGDKVFINKKNIQNKIVKKNFA